jgi:hypothetical protein
MNSSVVHVIHNDPAVVTTIKSAICSGPSDRFTVEYSGNGGVGTPTAALANRVMELPRMVRETVPSADEIYKPVFDDRFDALFDAEAMMLEMFMAWGQGKSRVQIMGEASRFIEMLFRTQAGMMS